MSKKTHNLNISNLKAISKDQEIFFMEVKKFQKRFTFYLNTYKYLKITT